MDKIGQLLDTTKLRCKEKQEEAKRLTDGLKPSDGARFPYKEKFDRLPNSIEELNEHIDELEGQIACMQMNNEEHMIEEFENRQEQARRLRIEIQNSDKNHDEIGRKMEQLHNEWFPQITAILNTINENFSSFMKSMSCAGEVELIRGEEVRWCLRISELVENNCFFQRDYDKYGIEIRVKYRANERLQALDRFVQSGGERAVAIAVYSLSLQHLSQVPFRCVDEINQGMDPTNERKIFDMLIKNVSKPGQSQFFYITPKVYCFHLHGNELERHDVLFFRSFCQI